MATTDTERDVLIEDFYVTNQDVTKKITAVPLGRLANRLPKLQDRRLIQSVLYLKIYTEEQLTSALDIREKAEGKKSLDQIIFATLDELDKMKIQALQQGMQFVPLEKFSIPDNLYRLFSPALAQKHYAVPFRAYDPEEEGDDKTDKTKLFFKERTILMLLGSAVDPTAKSAITNYFSSLPKSYHVEFLVANPAMITRIIDANYSATSLAVDEDAEDEKEKKKKEAEDGPANEFFNKTFDTAVELGASDVHLEGDPNRPGSLQVRMRIDGVLSVVTRADKRHREPILAVMKLAFGMDISERRIPQSGRGSHKLGNGRKIELRAETLPAIDSEDMVIRLLDKGKLNLKLDDMNWSEDNLTRFRKGYKRPSGAILVTGPTGSGKTSTLYAVLQELTKESEKLITIEDPVEYTLPGLRQVQVNAKQNLSFAAVLKAILRSDPDIVMVGEIRDGETAGIAMRAANTGHLVLSTLHVNEAAAAPIQLINMNVPNYLVAETLAVVIAQRLVRKLCMRCKVLVPPTEVEMKALLTNWSPEQRDKMIKDLDKYKIYGPHKDGCSECNKGYKGRTAIHEVMNVGDPEKEIILSDNPSSLALRELAMRDGGMHTLRQDAMFKAFQGMTSLDEVRRVTTD